MDHLAFAVALFGRNVDGDQLRWDTKKYYTKPHQHTRKKPNMFKKSSSHRGLNKAPKDYTSFKNMTKSRKTRQSQKRLDKAPAYATTVATTVNKR